jgi:hypothetical protein
VAPVPAEGTEAVPVVPFLIVAGAVIVAFGAALTVIDLVPDAAHPVADEIVTERAIGPLVAAEKTIERVPTPEVIVPLVIDQLYEAPAPPSGTEAVLPEEPPHTAVGAVIVAMGKALIEETAEPIAEQPAPLTTVTANVTVPVVPAVNDTDLVPAPAVIDPLVMDQE